MTRMPRSLRLRRPDALGFALLGAASLASLAALAAFARIDNAPVPERDDPAIQYGALPAHDPIAELNRRIASGQVSLKFDGRAGYLRSVLDALNVPVESQLALFSKTGIQATLTNPHNPRTLFFSDSVVIGWVRGGIVEAAAEDPRQGVFFYTLSQTPSAKPQFMPGAGCVACHDSNEAMGVLRPRVTLGFANTIGMISSSGGFAPSSFQSNPGSALRMSTTKSWRARPTCCAASPIPCAACMAPIISSANDARAASNAVIFSPFRRKTGSL